MTGKFYCTADSNLKCDRFESANQKRKGSMYTHSISNYSLIVTSLCQMQGVNLQLTY